MFLFNKHAFHIMVEVRAVQLKLKHCQFSPFLGSEPGMNPPLQSQTTILFFLCFFNSIVTHFCLLFYFLCLGLLHGWISLLLPAGNVLCMVEKKPTRLRMQPSFFVWMSTFKCLCNALCVMWPSFQNGICSDLWLTAFPVRRETEQECLKLKSQPDFPS